MSSHHFPDCFCTAGEVMLEKFAEDSEKLVACLPYLFLSPFPRLRLRNCVKQQAPRTLTKELRTVAALFATSVMLTLHSISRPFCNVPSFSSAGTMDTPSLHRLLSSTEATGLPDTVRATEYHRSESTATKCWLFTTQPKPPGHRLCPNRGQ